MIVEFLLLTGPSIAVVIVFFFFMKNRNPKQPNFKVLPPKDERRYQRCYESQVGLREISKNSADKRIEELRKLIEDTTEKVKNMKLDVGCGGKPTGDINCDLYAGKTPHTDELINTKRNFVQCDACYLPFRDKTFSIVYSRHVLEHLKRPYEALEEFKRVSSRYVYIKVPDVPKFTDQNPEHLYGWDKSTLTHLLKKIFPHVVVYSKSSPMRGRRLERMKLLQRLLSFLLGKFFLSDLIAICEV